MIVDIEALTEPADKKIPYVLGKVDIDGKTDTKFVDATKGLLFNIDVSLYFIDLLIPRIQKIGNKVLPKSYVKKIAKHELAGDFKELIPPKNFIDGWID